MREPSRLASSAPSGYLETAPGYARPRPGPAHVGGRAEAKTAEAGHRGLPVPELQLLAEAVPGRPLLHSSLDSPMQTPAWLQAAAISFTGMEPELVCIRGSALEAIAPLARRRGSGERLETLGGRELGEPLDLLWRDERALETLCEKLARDLRPLLLVRQPLGSPVLPTLRRSYGSRAVIRTVDRVGLPLIALHAGWAEPESQLSARRRQDLRRARRRAEAFGAVAVDVQAPAPHELDRLLGQALRVEAASWKGRVGTALLHDDLRRNFYYRYAHAAAADGKVRIALLRIGGETAAMQFAIVHAGAWWLLKIGYDERFACCSPGQLLIRETIAAAQRLGLARYEFLGTSAPWTRVWTCEERPAATVLVYPRRPRTLRVLVRDGSDFGRRALARRHLRHAR